MRFCEFDPAVPFNYIIHNQSTKGEKTKLSITEQSEYVVHALSDTLKKMHVHDLLEFLMTGIGTIVQTVAEDIWIRNKRPYYRIHPSLVPAFLRTKLTATWAQMDIRLDEPIVIELAHQDTTDLYIRSILVCVFDPNNPLPGSELLQWVAKLCAATGIPKASSPMLFMAIDYNEIVSGDVVAKLLDMSYVPKDKAEHTFIHVPLNTDFTLSELVEAAQSHMVIPDEATLSAAGKVPINNALVRQAMQIVIMTLAVQNDSELVTPDVLAKDAAKFKATGDTKYVEKAKRNGKYGFIVGGARNGPVPHWRGMHFAWRWYGVGKTRKRYVKIDGTIVKRDKLTEIPQGWRDT